MIGKTVVINYFLSIVILIFLGCASTGGNAVQDAKVKISNEHRPDWIDNPLEGQYVGVSKNFSGESSARQDAVNDARKKIIDHLGLRIDRKIVDRMITQGKTDEIISANIIDDATTKMVGQTILKVRAIKYYTERWKIVGNGKTSYYWKTFCLVPFSKENHLSFARDWINQVVNLAQHVYKAAVQMEAQNKIISAAIKYQQMLNILKEVEGIADFEPVLMKPVRELKIKTSARLADIKPYILKNQLSAALHELSTQIPIKPLRVAVWNINYEDTPIGSKFSQYFADALSIALTRSADYEVFDRSDLEMILQEKRLSMTGIIDEETKVLPGMLKGVEALIHGKYWNEPDQVRMSLFLTSVKTGRLGAIELILPKLAFPERMKFIPANLDEALQTYKNFGGHEKLDGVRDFKIRVWADKGNGGVYKVGEKVIIYFKANIDCYLKLYHTDSAGNILQLFPNQYIQDNFIKARRVYSIPDETSDFEFVVQPPFGSEMIKAIASLSPFSIKDKFTNSEVFKPMGIASKKNIHEILTRDIGMKARKDLAESICVLTSVE